MKKSLLITVVFLVTSMLAGSVGLAEPTHPNEVGLYTEPNGFGPTGTYIVGVPVEIYLVLTKPADAQNGYEPFAHVQGFELALHFEPNPTGDLFKLFEELPEGSVNVGDNSDINQGFLAYVVGISSSYPLMVTDESVVLMTLHFFKLSSSPTAVTLKPTSPASIPGQLAFLGESYEQLRAMYPVSGSHDAPVFFFNDIAVAVENESFGSVKALYR